MSNMKIKQAFIFAAGRGSRMMPLTLKNPKPLIQIKGKALLDHIIEKLDKISSLEKIIINGFYLSEKLQEHLQKLNNNKIIFSKEVEKIETGGGLKFASDKIDFNSPLLTINGDLFWQDNNNEDINKLIANFEQGQNDILLGLKKSEEYFGYEGKNGGDFCLEAEQKLSKKIQNTHAFVGISIINPQILNEVDEKCFSMSHFYQKSLKNDGFLEKVGGVELDGRYFHIGTPEALENSEKLL